MNHPEPTAIRTLAFCPVTGLSVTRVPEWGFTEESSTGTYSTGFSLIGDSIILARVEGYTTRAISERYLDRLDAICDEVLPSGEQIILMEDYTGHRGVEGAARNYYVNRQKKNPRLAAVVYFKVSPFFRAVIQVSRIFIRVPFPIEIAPNYTAAVRTALSLKEKALNRRYGMLGSVMPGSRKWRLDCGTFSVDAEVLSGTVLFSVTHGRLTTADEVATFIKFYRNILKEWSPPGGGYFRLMDWSGLRHVSWKARGLYMQAMKVLHKEYPCRMAVLYGLSPFVRAVYSASRHFLPIPIITAANREEALSLLRKFSASHSAYVPENAQDPSAALTAGEVDAQIRILIDLMSSINWEQIGIRISDEMLEKAGPFRPMYEALLVLKQDFDEVAQKEREAEGKRREIEEQLHHAEKMQTIGTLAGGIAHDFNNMLGGITGFASLLQKRYGPLDPGVERFSGMILDTGKRAASLVESLLTFARKGRQETLPVDVNDLIGNLVTLLSHTLDKGIQLSMVLDGGKPLILGDRTQLQNSLLNLAINAADAMPNGGKLTFTVRDRMLDASAVLSLVYPIPPGDYLEISVSDTGTGIPPEIRGRIFEPFFTTKETGKGTGLGLASVYGTLQDHSAGIALESEPDRGTLFRLYFKKITGAPVEAGPAKVPDTSCRQGRILLVDDERMLRAAVQEMLLELGYTVSVAENGQEAVELFEKDIAAFDLVILDLMMPRMSGEECYRRIRLLNPFVKVIISSGYSRNVQVDALLDQGVSAFLPKPFNLNTLSETLRRVCG